MLCVTLLSRDKQQYETSRNPSPTICGYVQGDTSGQRKPPVDIDVTVVFYYKDFILKCNFQSNVNGRFSLT